MDNRQQSVMEVLQRTWPDYERDRQFKRNVWRAVFNPYSGLSARLRCRWVGYHCWYAISGSKKVRSE